LSEVLSRIFGELEPAGELAETVGWTAYGGVSVRPLAIACPRPIPSCCGNGPRSSRAWNVSPWTNCMTRHAGSVATSSHRPE